jgi:hypothetical protein
MKLDSTALFVCDARTGYRSKAGFRYRKVVTSNGQVVEALFATRIGSRRGLDVGHAVGNLDGRAGNGRSRRVR